MKWLRNLLFVMLIGMLLLRNGIFVARIIYEWKQPSTKWQPANAQEQLIWQRYQEVK